MLARKKISCSLPASAIELGKKLYTFLWMFRGLVEVFVQALNSLTNA